MDQSPLVPPTLTQEPQALEQPSAPIINTTNIEKTQEDDSAPAQLQVETTHVDTAANSTDAHNKVTPSPQNQQLVEPAKSNSEEVKSADEETAPTAETDASTTDTTPAEVPALEQISNLDVTELTTQIMDMINQDDDEGDVTKTTLMKKNVELQEFMVKLIELLREKTNLSANLERQNTALTSQARSLRDVIAITKDLLSIRNMEVDHLHVDMGAMEKCIKEERERHNTAVERLSQAMTLNDKLKTEYLNQMEMFGKLRDKYNEKIMILNKEIQRLRDLLKDEPPLPEPAVSAPQDNIIIQPNAVATEETNGIL